MKRAVSISIGSSKRNKVVEIELLGQQVRLERIGTDGDMDRAARLFQEFDGQVDAFGVGGTDLGLLIDGRWYPLHSVRSLVAQVRQTPVVDGCGLKNTLETRVVRALREHSGAANGFDRVLVVAGVDRWGMLSAFVDGGYSCRIGDLMFTLGIPLPLHRQGSIKVLAAVLMPVVGRMPFHWVYPVGEAQEKRTPRWQEHFGWAQVIAGDCHYITRYMPDDLAGKVIVTNTTTPEDTALFKRAGVKYLVTTTPVLDGRSFGTNMMEAALVAASGRTRPVDYAHPGDYFAEVERLVDRLDLKPQIQELN